VLGKLQFFNTILEGREGKLKMIFALYLKMGGGKDNRNFVYTLGTLSKVIEPLSFWTSSFTIANPNPFPLLLRDKSHCYIL